MIIVNIRIPAIEKVYNFSIDEKAHTGALVEEIVEMVKQKEGIQFHGEMGRLVLCSVEKGVSFDKSSSLGEYGIRGGDELILV